MKDKANSPPSRERLLVVPPDLAEAIRAASVDEDADRLSDLVDGVAEHDADVAEYVRGLIEDVAYGVLEDLFEIRGR
ncbi:MAG: hypothetical protein OEM81_06915 [Acidimicrobiia bacterium]|nr:hypothetical protein [Acidimicrobiia bacterium]